MKDIYGHAYFLHIGICTKLLGRNSSYVPKIGDVVDWIGSPLSSDTFNAYRAEFYGGH